MNEKGRKTRWSGSRKRESLRKWSFSRGFLRGSGAWENLRPFSRFLEAPKPGKWASRAGETRFPKKARFLEEIWRCWKSHEKVGKKPEDLKKKAWKSLEKAVKNHGFYSVSVKITFFSGISLRREFVLKNERFLRVFRGLGPPKKRVSCRRDAISEKSSFS